MAVEEKVPIKKHVFMDFNTHYFLKPLSLNVMSRLVCESPIAEGLYEN